MPPRVIAALLITFVPSARCQQGSYRQGSLPSDQSQAIYSSDPRDPWNRIFYCLFTRTVKIRLTDDFPEGAPFQEPAAGSAYALARRLSDRTFERIESGDRTIDPLYPSFLSSSGTAQLFKEPRYSEFEQALRAALAERNQRPPIQRALMQSDLWAAYDLVYRNQRVDAARAPLILKLLAGMIRKLALTLQEIIALPDNYAVGLNPLRLPDIFGDHSNWIEIEWGPDRMHDGDSNYRRSTRIFLNPGSKLSDPHTFLESFRVNNGPHAPLTAVALITQPLLIDNSGNPAPSPISTEVQVREFAFASDGQLSKTAIAVFELSRRAMLTEPASGGLVRLDETAPAYLPTSGNDYSFASAMTGTPILGSLKARCAGCHGANVSSLFTFMRHQPQVGVIRILDKRAIEHAQYVVNQKIKLDSWKSLQSYWTSP